MKLQHQHERSAVLQDPAPKHHAGGGGGGGEGERAGMHYYKFGCVPYNPPSCLYMKASLCRATATWTASWVGQEALAW